jgi:hypothetical protein
VSSSTVLTCVRPDFLAALQDANAASPFSHHQCGHTLQSEKTVPGGVFRREGHAPFLRRQFGPVTACWPAAMGQAPNEPMLAALAQGQIGVKDGRPDYPVIAGDMCAISGQHLLGQITASVVQIGPHLRERGPAVALQGRQQDGQAGNRVDVSTEADRQGRFQRDRCQDREGTLHKKQSRIEITRMIIMDLHPFARPDEQEIDRRGADQGHSRLKRVRGLTAQPRQAEQAHSDSSARDQKDGPGRECRGIPGVAQQRPPRVRPLRQGDRAKVRRLAVSPCQALKRQATDKSHRQQHQRDRRLADSKLRQHRANATRLCAFICGDVSPRSPEKAVQQY